MDINVTIKCPDLPLAAAALAKAIAELTALGMPALMVPLPPGTTMPSSHPASAPVPKSEAIASAPNPLRVTFNRNPLPFVSRGRQPSVPDAS